MVHSAAQKVMYKALHRLPLSHPFPRQEVKYKGHRSTSTLVKATVDETGQHAVCGSDNGWVYAYDLLLPDPEDKREGGGGMWLVHHT
jgi:hypothetical protein